MKTHRRILLTTAPLLILIGTAALRDQQSGFELGLLLLTITSSVLGVFCYSLFMKEIRQGTKWVFFNFALLFGINGLTRPVLELLKPWWMLWNEHVEAYMFQYQILLYFLLLLISMVYVLMDTALSSRASWQKYFLTLVVVGVIWGSLAYPYCSNPEYLRETTDMRDFYAIHNALSQLEMNREQDITAQKIASVLKRQLHEEEATGDGASARTKESRVSEILPYVRGYNVTMLYYRPLWLDCLWMSLACLSCVLFFIVIRFRQGSADGAYVEKIVWCFLPYCAFEALHYFAYTRVSAWVVLMRVVDLGRYLSLTIMLLLSILVILRLRFIQSVEGGYYERRLLTDAPGITRWRDAFDNWILRNFMNPGELDRRFLIRRKDQE